VFWEKVGVTIIELPVRPSLQVTVPTQPVAVRVALPPWHIVVRLAVMLGIAGLVITVTVRGCEALPSPQMPLHVAV
jgi:hypothetical protein